MGQDDGRDVLVDATGRRHGRAGTGARIVSLVPSITELLFALGLGDRVVGRTTFCVHPADAVRDVPRVGGTKKVAFDRLAATRPTHVVVNVDENRKEDVPRIASLGAAVVATHPLAPADNLSLYRLLGGIFGAEAAAERLCAEFRAALEQLESQAGALPERRVLYLIWREPWMTVSPETYISRTLSLVRWRTLPTAPDQRYPEIGDDDPVWRAADLVLLSSEPYPFKDRHVAEVRARLADEATPVRFIDGEMTSWYGSRAIAGLRYLLELATRLPGNADDPSTTQLRRPG